MEKGCIFLSPTSDGSLEFHRFAKVVQLNVSPSLSVDALESSKIIPVKTSNPSLKLHCSNSKEGSTDGDRNKYTLLARSDSRHTTH